MADISFIDRRVRVIRKAAISIFTAAMALAWNVRAQEVQPMYGVPIASTIPSAAPKYGVVPYPSVMYGPPPGPSMLPSPLPTYVPSPTPNFTGAATLPMAAIALACSAVILVICAAVGYIWLSRHGKGKK